MSEPKETASVDPTAPPDNSSGGGADRDDGRRFWFPLGGLLILHAALGIHTAANNSVTHDEYWHLAIGLRQWQTGRYDFDRLNPPLIRAWGAIALLPESPPHAELGDNPELFEYGNSLAEANRDSFESLYFRGRLMIVLLSVATGLLLAVWSRQLFGAKAAILTTLLWCCAPNILAHGSLVTTDLAAATCFVATLFANDRFARTPCVRAATIFGLLLGLSQLVKFTCLLLVPLSVCAWWIVRMRARDAVAPSRRRVLSLWLLSGVSGLIVLNAGYGFQGTLQPLRSYEFQSESLMSWKSLFSFAQGCPVPLPRDYVLGVDAQRQVMEQPHPVYLDGKWSLEGHRDYYVKALWYKLPHATQLLGILSFLFLLVPGARPRQGRELLLLLPPLLLLPAIASFSDMQLGVRYLLPSFPFLFLLCGTAAKWFEWKRFPIRSMLLVIFALGVPWGLRNHPRHLAYFNEIAGGPAEGRHRLADSNLDWGQDLRRLADFLRSHDVGELGLAYFGTVPPELLGVRYQLPPSYRPQPGRYAVSVNFLLGRPHPIHDGSGGMRAVHYEEFGYFRYFEPVARIGDTIDVFELTEAQVAHWNATISVTPP